ncbi:uncharacterized protein [Choristoneura fumiferana]|uniref:uncharacterized protein n=1 Tax=Choristoneura fumiferana TaxID=7141 RepID=UPI003D157569
MESSDAEQSVRWTCSVTVKCEPVTVKEEPQGGECGVSEAAVAGLYAGHEVKDEIVIGPETVQQQDVAFSMQNDLSRTEGPRSRKPERDAKVVSDCIHTCPGDGSCCNRSTKQQYGLTKCSCNLPTPLKCHQQSALNSIEQYPSKLQRAGGASLHSRPGEESRCDMSHKQQFQLRSCSVRLERILMEDLPTSSPLDFQLVDAAPDCTHTCPGDGARCNRSTGRAAAARAQELFYTLNRTEVVPCQLQPAGGAGAAPECTHTRPGEGPRCNMSHDQQFQLRSCSVRLERMPMEDLPRCDTCLVIFYSRHRAASATARCTFTTPYNVHRAAP